MKVPPMTSARFRFIFALASALPLAPASLVAAPSTGGTAAPATSTPAPALPASGPGADQTPRVLPTEDAIARALAGPHIRFCREPHFPLTRDEARWCELLPKSPDPRATRCPDLVRACAAGATAKAVPRPKPFEIKLPELGGLGQVLFWLLLATAVGGLLYLIVRAAVRGLGDRESAPPTTPEAGVSITADDAAARAIERDVERLLARAETAARAGDFAAAVADLHAALLRRLDGEGRVRIHPSATNGDYVREVRASTPTIAGPVANVVRDVEAVQFGVTVPDAGFYQSLLGRVLPLARGALGGAMRGAAGALLIALALLGTLAACGGCNLPLRDDPDHSPSGNAAVIDYLTMTGLEARERLAPLSDLEKDEKKARAASTKGAAILKDPDKAPDQAPDSEPDKDRDADKEKRSAAVDHKAAVASTPVQQLVLLPDADLEPDDWKAIAKWLTHSDHTLVIAGARTLPDWLPVEFVDQGASGPVRLSELGKTWGEWDEDVVDSDSDDDDGDTSGDGAPNQREAGGKAAAANDPEASKGHPAPRGAQAPAAVTTPAEPPLVGHAPGAGWVRGGQSDSAALLLRGDKPYAITTWDLRNIIGTVIVLADDRLFTNAALAVGDNAALLSRIMNSGGTTVELAGAYSGLVASTPVDSIARGRLAPFMAQLMLCLILFFLMRGVHFGRPRDAAPIARRRFAEHVRALGLQYARAHAGEHALQSYGAWATERLRARVRLVGDRGLGDLAAAVAARTGKPVGDVARLLFEARRDPHAAATLGGRSTRATAEPYLAMMRELEALVAESGAGASGAGRATRGARATQSHATQPPTSGEKPTP